MVWCTVCLDTGLGLVLTGDVQMHTQEISLEVPLHGARRATEEGSTSRRKKPERFSARQQTEVVLRLLRGEALDLLSPEIGIPAARLATWREAFLAAGQEAMKTTRSITVTMSLAAYAKSRVSRPWQWSSCVRRLRGLRPAAL
jgi:hypothetical protein